MNEQAIQGILEGIIKNVMGELGAHAPQTSPHACACVNTGEAIPVELSARHAHLSEHDALALFGAPLTPSRELSQPGQFLCKERVRLIGPKGVMDNVAVLGPSRGNSQVEISKTDARILGIDTPVRQSGDIAKTPGIILTSPTSIVGLEEGLIVAARHLHMTPEDARRLGVAEGDRVNVALDTERPLILEDVLVRVNEAFRLTLHIDPDEGNSAGWKTGVIGKIVGKGRGQYELCGC